MPCIIMCVKSNQIGGKDSQQQLSSGGQHSVDLTGREIDERNLHIERRQQHRGAEAAEHGNEERRGEGVQNDAEERAKGGGESDVQSVVMIVT